MAGADVASQLPASSPPPPGSDRHSKEIPAPLTLDTPAPSSPFPSPSSSFVPPPIPGAHEFAIKPNMTRLVRRKKSGSPLNVPEDSPSKKSETSDSGVSSSKEPNGLVPQLDTNTRTASPGPATTPLTPTPTLPFVPSGAASEQPAHNNPASTQGRSTPTQVQITLPPPPPSPPQVFAVTAPSLIRTSSGSGTASKHTSLSSTRPAPPSPASSRRQSLRSRHRSGVSIASSSSRFATIKAGDIPQVKRRGEIKIRDFAFPAVDTRHTGRGPDTPKVIKRLLKKHGPVRPSPSRRESGMSESSLDSEEAGSRRSSGFGSWSAFRWAGKLGGGWGFGSSNGGGSSGANNGSGQGSRAGGGAAYTPSQQDFERNFDDSVDVEPAHSPPDIDDRDYLSDEYDEDEDGEDAGEAENEDLLPGLYRALYDFEPEGTAEMGLREGQSVRVVGRGGGVGWAIAVRPDAHQQQEGEGDDDDGGEDKESNWALVPESYLKLVQLDYAEPGVPDGPLADDPKETEG